MYFTPLLPFEVVIQYQVNVAPRHRPEKIESRQKKEVVWATDSAAARRVTQGKFGAPAITVTQLWTSPDTGEA